MNRFAVYFGRLVLMMAGFFAACLVASLFLHLTWFGPSIAAMEPADRPAAAPLYFSVPFLAMMAGHAGFFQSLVLLAAAEIWQRRGWLFYALGGAAVALPVVAVFMQDRGIQAFLAATFIGAGMAGGIAYWIVAGRSAGLWIERVRDGAAPRP